MEPDDPNREIYLNKFFELSQLKRSVKAKIDPIGERMNELAREITTLKPGDPRQAQIVQEIMRLSDLLKQTRNA